MCSYTVTYRHISHLRMCSYTVVYRLAYVYLVHRHLHSCVCYQWLFGVLVHFESNGNAHETGIFLALPCDAKDLEIFDGIESFITCVLLPI